MIDRRTLPLSALRAFESAALYKHLGRAGEELGVTHGAISHHIRSLEDKLGIALFIRANNRLELTQAGMTLYEAVKTGLDLIVEGTHKLDPDELSGNLVIGCTQTIATSWAAKHICEFRNKYPSIQIFVREIKPRQQNIPKEIDIAICYGSPKASEKSVIKLASPMLYPVCSPTLLADKKRVSRVKDIVNYTLLHDDQVSWSKWFAAYDLAIPDMSQSIYFPNTSQALTAARLGYGVALCNTFETQEFIREGQLVRLTEKSIEEEDGYFLFIRNSKTVSLKSKVFAEWIDKTLSTF